MNPFRLLISATVLLAYSIPAFAQSKHGATIQGRVINEQGEPERGVKVNVTEHGCFRTVTTTDVYGMYRLQVAPGKYTVKVRYDDKNTEEKNVELTRDEKLQLDFSERKPLEIVGEDLR